MFVICAHRYTGPREQGERPVEKHLLSFPCLFTKTGVRLRAEPRLPGIDRRTLRPPRPSPSYSAHNVAFGVGCWACCGSQPQARIPWKQPLLLFSPSVILRPCPLRIHGAKTGSGSACGCTPFSVLASEFFFFSVGVRLVTNPWPLASRIGCGVATCLPRLPLFRGEHPRAPPVGLDHGSGPFLTRCAPLFKSCQSSLCTLSRSKIIYAGLGTAPAPASHRLASAVRSGEHWTERIWLWASVCEVW